MDALDTLMNTYARQPVTFERGAGAWLWDTDGRKYLDALSGVAVCNLGHAHRSVTEALCTQAGRLVHTSNHYRVALQERLGAKLADLAAMERVFFCNSGAEANETALKIARLYGHKKGIHNPAVVVAEHSFHGRTLATLSATGNRKVHAGFEPLVQGFVRVPFDDIDTLAQVLKHDPHIVAVLLEPAQGEGGVRLPAPDYLTRVRALCDAHGLLMMLDEIQTGMARSGEWFAWQRCDTARPDVMTLAKALGNGVPIGACLTRGLAADLMQPGSHGSTFGGNPLACAVGLAVIGEIEEKQLWERATVLGMRIIEGLCMGLSDLPQVVDVRGLGLMIGVELDRPCFELVHRARERGVLINVTAERVIRLLPPLILTNEEADLIVTTVVDVVREFGVAATTP